MDEIDQTPGAGTKICNYNAEMCGDKELPATHGYGILTSCPSTVCIHMYTSVCVYAYMCVYACVYIYIYVCACTHMCVYMYIYIYDINNLNK